MEEVGGVIFEVRKSKGFHCVHSHQPQSVSHGNVLRFLGGTRLLCNC